MNKETTGTHRSATTTALSASDRQRLLDITLPTYEALAVAIGEEPGDFITRVVVALSPDKATR